MATLFIKEIKAMDFFQSILKLGYLASTQSWNQLALEWVNFFLFVF